jgi:hypothetical protein
VNAGGAGFVLNVSGSGFQPGAGVRWNNVRLSTSIDNATSLRAAVSAKLIAKPGTVSVTVMNPGGVPSSAFTFTIHPLTPTPMVTGLSPASVTAGGSAFTLTVTGSDFMQGASVQSNRVRLQTTVASSTQLKVAVPATLITSAGNVALTVVNPGNVVSTEVNLRVNPPAAAPAISALVPNAATAGFAVALTANGTGFQPGASLEWNGSPLQTSFVSSSQLRAQVPASLLPAPGNASVVAVNPGHVVSAPMTFSINPPPVVVVAPVITGLSPNSATAGGPAFTLTVSGSGFAQNAAVYWNRTALVVSSGSATQLRASVPANLIANAGTASVTVVNPDGLSSGAMNFTINPPAVVAPAISSLSPGSVAAAGPAFTLTVNGSGFQPGAAVRWNGTKLNTTFVSAAQVTAAVPANLIAGPGSAPITVLNPGNVASGAVTLTILPPPVNPDVELIKSVLNAFARAYTTKDINDLKALYPRITKEDLGILQDRDRRSTLEFTIQILAPPVVTGNEATVNARKISVTRLSSGKREAPVTRDVVISLHKDGGRWTISRLP